MLIPLKYIYWLIDENLISMMALMAPICLTSVSAKHQELHEFIAKGEGLRRRSH